MKPSRWKGVTVVIEIEETEAAADGAAGSFLGLAKPKGQQVGLPFFDLNHH
jgi:hypothetical protein